MDNSQVNRLFQRIKDTSDGQDLIAYLETLSLRNYRAFKQDDSENNELHKGYAIAIDQLIELFETCNEPPKTNPLVGKRWA